LSNRHYHTHQYHTLGIKCKVCTVLQVQILCLQAQNLCLKFHRTPLNIIVWQILLTLSIMSISFMIGASWYTASLTYNNNQEDWELMILDTRLVFPILSNDLDITIFNNPIILRVMCWSTILLKLKSLTDTSSPRNVLANDFGGSLSKIDHYMFKKCELIIWLLHVPIVKIPTILIEHLSLLVKIYWWSIMTIEIAIAMKCSFVIKTGIQKKSEFCSNALFYKIELSVCNHFYSIPVPSN